VLRRMWMMLKGRAHCPIALVESGMYCPFYLGRRDGRQSPATLEQALVSHCALRGLLGAAQPAPIIRSEDVATTTSEGEEAGEKQKLQQYTPPETRVDRRGCFSAIGTWLQSLNKTLLPGRWASPWTCCDPGWEHFCSE